MKKILSLVLVLAMVLSSFSFAFAAPNDVADTEYEDAINRLAILGVLEGYPDGTFKPENTITRAEFAASVVRVLGLDAAANAAVGATGFTDVLAGGWASGYINIASRMGYVKGNGDGTFAPNAAITYEQAVTMVIRALGYEEAAMARGGYPFGYLVIADQEDLTDGIAGVQGFPASRGMVALLLDNALETPMMIQIGYGSSTKWVKSGTDDTEEEYLLDKIGFTKVSSDRVVDFDSEDLEITFKDYGDVVVAEDFDFEAVLGLRLTAWLNGDDEVTIYTVKDTPIYDAIAWDADDEVLTVVDADEDYDVNDDAVFYVNGEKTKVKDLAAAYDYAKVVLYDKEVIFVDAYSWDNSIVFDEIDDTDVIGYGVDADEITIKDMDDFTIVKDGKTVALDALEAGDILYYNEDVEYAEVYNYSVEGEVTAVFEGDFDLDKDNYDIAGTYLQDGDDIEAIDVLVEGVLGDMKASEKEVEVFLDREGNVRHVVGNLEEEETSTIAGYVINNVTKLTGGSSRTAKYNVDVVTDAGEYIEYNVTASDFADANDDDKITEAGDIFTIENGDIVKITLDEDGDVSEVAKVDYNTETITADGYIDVDDDKYTQEGNKLKSSAIVFDISNYDDDADDIVASKYSDVDFDTIKTGTVYFNSNSDVTYIVVTNNGKEATEYIGFVQEVKKLSNGKYRTWIIVDGEEKSDDLSTKYNEGIVVTLDIDEDGNFSNVSKVTSADESGTLKDISRKNKTFTVEETQNLKLADTSYIFDTTNNNNKEISFTDLEKDMKVEVYFEGNSNRYVEFLLVVEGASGEDDVNVTTEGTVTYKNADGSKIEVEGTIYTVNDTTVLRNEVGVIEFDTLVDINGALTENTTQVFDIVANANNEISSFKYRATTANRNAAKAVIDMIDALGSNPTAAKVEVARYAYDGTATSEDTTGITPLTVGAQRNLVTNLAKLVAAETKIASAAQEILDGQSVKSDIAGLTAASTNAQVAQVRADYNDLTAVGRAEVDNLAALVAAETNLANAKQAFATKLAAATTLYNQEAATLNGLTQFEKDAITVLDAGEPAAYTALVSALNSARITANAFDANDDGESVTSINSAASALDTPMSNVTAAKAAFDALVAQVK